MWLPDERYSTFVGFVSGCQAGGTLLDGFSEWLAVHYGRSPSSIVWWGQVADHVLPDRHETEKRVGMLGEQDSAPLVAELFDRLQDFLAET